MKPRRIFSALLLSLGLILLTFAATCRLVMTNIQIDYDPSSPATVTLTVKVPAFLQNDWESKAIRTYFTTWQRDYNKASAHYNEDAIFSALRAGLHDFICHHAPIFTTYKEVGQAFPAYYL